MVAFIAKQWTRKLEVYRTVAMFEFYLSSSCLDWGSDLFLWAERNMQNGGTCLRSSVAQNRRRGREFTRDKPRLQTIEWMTFVRAWQKVSKEKKNSKKGLKIFLSHLSLKLGLRLLFFFNFLCVQSVIVLAAIRRRTLFFVVESFFRRNTVTARSRMSWRGTIMTFNLKINTQQTYFLY